MVMVLLAHVRGLRSEQRWKECLSKVVSGKRAWEEINSFELPDTPACSPGGLTEAAEGCSPVPASKPKIKASLGLLAKRPAGKQKKPAAMPVKAQKKKAAAEKKELTAEEKKNLHFMTYKGTGAVAVRVRKGRQLLQVKASTLEESKNLAAWMILGLVTL